MAEIEWTSMRRFLLDWLSKEDTSALGECQGSDLDALIAGGLASVEGPMTSGYSRVSLTKAGYEQVAKFRAAS